MPVMDGVTVLEAVAVAVREAERELEGVGVGEVDGAAPAITYTLVLQLVDRPAASVTTRATSTLS